MAAIYSWLQYVKIIDGVRSLFQTMPHVHWAVFTETMLSHMNIVCHRLVNSSPPSAAYIYIYIYMRQWTGWPLVQVLACCLIGAKLIWIRADLLMVKLDQPLVFDRRTGRENNPSVRKIPGHYLENEWKNCLNLVWWRIDADHIQNVFDSGHGLLIFLILATFYLEGITSYLAWWCILTLQNWSYFGYVMLTQIYFVKQGETFRLRPLYWEHVTQMVSKLGAWWYFLTIFKAVKILIIPCWFFFQLYDNVWLRQTLCFILRPIGRNSYKHRPLSW